MVGVFADPSDSLDEVHPSRVRQIPLPVVVLEQRGRLPPIKKTKKENPQRAACMSKNQDVRILMILCGGFFVCLIKLRLRSHWQTSGNQMAN